MRFLGDMGISPRSMAYLRSLGHDAIHLNDLGQHLAADRDILALAREQGRILLTHDLDFGDLLAASGDQLPSVVIFRLRDMRPPHLDRSLQRVIRAFEEALQKGAVVVVTEGLNRLRSLPLKKCPGDTLG